MKSDTDTVTGIGYLASSSDSSVAVICHQPSLSQARQRQSLSASPAINPINTKSVWSFTYSGEHWASSRCSIFVLVVWPERAESSMQLIQRPLSGPPSPFDTFSYVPHHTSGFTCHQSPAALQKPVHARCHMSTTALVFNNHYIPVHFKHFPTSINTSKLYLSKC